MKSQFQDHFKINDEFYTAEQIREAIKECFPYKKNDHTGLSKNVGLSRIVFRGKTLVHGDEELNLESLIPDIETLEIPEKLSHNHCYGIIEGLPKKPDPTASTFFIPTDLGYICDEIIPNGTCRSIHSENIYIALYKD